MAATSAIFLRESFLAHNLLTTGRHQTTQDNPHQAISCVARATLDPVAERP
jgi:hypothetical protein